MLVTGVSEARAGCTSRARRWLGVELRPVQVPVLVLFF